MSNWIKVIQTVLLVVLLTACTSTPAAKPTVPANSIAEFLDLIQSKDYHAMRQKGEATFKPGLHIPNHLELFGEFPVSTPEPGRIRYQLYSFSGEASAGEISLVLEPDSGEVIEFIAFEALLE